MTVEQDTNEREVQRLQQVIRDRRAAFEAATVGYSGLPGGVDGRAGNYGGAGQPRGWHSAAAHGGLLGAHGGNRQENRLITAAIVTATAALTLTPWLSTWWLVLLVPLLAVAVLVAVTARAAAPSDRSIRRTAAVIWAVTVGIDLALVTVSDQLAYWLTAVLMFVATVGGLVAACHLVFDVDPAESTETDS